MKTKNSPLGLDAGLEGLVLCSRTHTACPAALVSGLGPVLGPPKPGHGSSPHRAAWAPNVQMPMEASCYFTKRRKVNVENIMQK